MYSSGCFLRVLENKTICIFCDTAAVDLENTTVCTYSKDVSVFKYIKKIYECYIALFSSALFMCFLDYTVDKKNHTTVTTVIPKIGKISYP